MACKNQTHRMNHTKEQTPHTFLIRCFLYLLLSLLLLLLYTHPNFQRPHFQFDTVWLIDHVKL